MSNFLDWILNNPTGLFMFVIILVIVIIIYIVGFIQGREINFWPPKIGSKPKHIPSLPEVSLPREEYLKQVIKESMKPGTRSICLLSAGLQSRAENPVILELQETWKNIASSVSVKVLVQYNEVNLQGACELVAGGATVRFVRTTGIDSLSFHIFWGDQVPRIMINRKSLTNNLQEAPAFLQNLAMARVLGDYFDELWNESLPLTQILANKINSTLPASANIVQYESALRDISLAYLNSIPLTKNKILDDIKFRISLLRACHFVFIIGQPGAGKTVIRNQLSKLLSKYDIRVVSYADYPILYELFVNEILKLDGDHMANEAARKFVPDMHGGFRVIDETVFDDAIQKLKEICLLHMREQESPLDSGPVVLLEFARSNYVKALNLFGKNIIEKSQIIYVDASENIRHERIKKRVEVSPIRRDLSSILLVASDDHFISDEAMESLYSDDDINTLVRSKTFNERLHHLTNDNLTESDIVTWLVEYLNNVNNKMW